MKYLQQRREDKNNRSTKKEYPTIPKLESYRQPYSMQHIDATAFFLFIPLKKAICFDE